MLTDRTPAESPWRLTPFGKAVLLMLALTVAFLVGLLTEGPFDVPLCEEDEVLLNTGQCWPLNDADYEGGVGWVPADLVGVQEVSS